MVRACREEEEARLLALQDTYERFLREDRKRRERNDRILQTLDRIENQAAIMSAKTDRLRLLRRHYEAYLVRVHPEWKFQEQIATRINPGQTEQFRPYYMPRQYPPSQSAVASSVVKQPSVSQCDMYRYNNRKPDSTARDSTLTVVPSVNVTDCTKLPFSSSLKNVSTTNRNILPSKHLDVIPNELEYATTPGLSYRTEMSDMRNGLLDSNAEKSLRTAGSGVLKHSEGSRFGSILDLEMEQNTSRDLLNVSLSDDGIVQEETYPDLPLHHARFQDDAIGMLPTAKESLGVGKNFLGDHVGVGYLRTANSSIKSRNHPTDKQIPKVEKPENDFFNNSLEASLWSPQPLVKDNLKARSTMDVISSRQEEEQGDTASMNIVSGRDRSGFHWPSDKVNLDLDGRRQPEMVQNGKLNDGQGNRNIGEKHSAVRCEDKETAEAKPSLEKSAQSAGVELLQCNPELMQTKYQPNEPHATNKILQEECENNQPLHLLGSDHFSRQPGESVDDTNKMKPQMIEPLREVSNIGREKDSVFSTQISKQSGNEFNNKRENDPVGGKNMYILSGEDTKKDDESSDILKGQVDLLNDNESGKDQFVMDRQKQNEGDDDILPKQEFDMNPNKNFGDRKHNECENVQNEEEHKEKYVLDEAETYKNVAEEKQDTVDTGQYHTFGEERQYMGEETDEYQAAGEDGQYSVDETGQYGAVGEEGQYIMDEDGQYIVDESGQYIVDEAGQYQKVGEDGQYIVDKAGKYHTDGEEGQYSVDEARHYQNVSEDGQYIVDEAGQYIVDEAGQYQKVDEDGQYIVDETGQYQAVGEEGQYIMDEAGQYQKVGEDGQYIVDEAGQYQTIGEEGEYIIDEAGQYHRVGKDGQYIIDEAGQYQTVGEEGQYIVDEAGQYQNVDEAGHYIGDEAERYKSCGGEGENIDESSRNRRGEGEQYSVNIQGGNESGGAEKQHSQNESKNEEHRVGTNEQYPYQSNDSDQYIGNVDSQHQQKCIVSDQGERVAANQQVLNSVSDEGQQQQQVAGAEYKHVREHGQYGLETESSGEEPRKVAHESGAEHSEQHREDGGLEARGTGHSADRGSIGPASTRLPDEETPAQPRDDAGDVGDAAGTSAARSDPMGDGVTRQPHGSSPRPHQASSQIGQSTSDLPGSRSNVFETSTSAVDTAHPNSARSGPPGQTVSRDRQKIGEDELSREVMNQRVRDVLGGLGQESSDESSDIPVVQPPAQGPAPGRAAPSSTALPAKTTLPRAVASKKLPGLSKMLESDSESLQFDANLTTSNDESDDFDLSSEK